MQKDVIYRSTDINRPVLKPAAVPSLGRSSVLENRCDVQCQTDPNDFPMSLGVKRKLVDTYSSAKEMDIDVPSSAAASDEIDYETTKREFEELYEEEDEYDEFEESTESEHDDSAFTTNEKVKICDITIRMMENDLLYYTGIPRESSHVIDLLVTKSTVSKRNIFLVLRKIRHNETFKILGDLFGITRLHAGKVFLSDIEKVATSLQAFICWPEPSDIQRNLPLQFKPKYQHAQVIVHCFEISIGKPKKPVEKALSWSKCKRNNTIKYLIGLTTEGVIIFISKGFLGRITYDEIVKRSGFLECIQTSTCVMVDRVFKDINSEITATGVKLLKTPSGSTSDASEETKTTRIHVIGKIRNCAFLKSQAHHSLLNYKRTFLIDFSIVIASAVCNMQGVLTKI